MDPESLPDHPEGFTVEGAPGRLSQQCHQFDAVFTGKVPVAALHLQLDRVFRFRIVAVFLEKNDGLILEDILFAGFPAAFEMAQQQGRAEVVAGFGGEVVAFGEIVPGYVIDQLYIVADGPLQQQQLCLCEVGDAVMALDPVEPSLVGRIAWLFFPLA